MRIHLFVNKKKCPGTKNVMDLTDEIKNIILENRVYNLPKEIHTPTINNTINNFNTMNNYINNLDHQHI